MRILLISDMHLSYENRLGYTQAERLEFMLRCLEAEHQKAPLDGILLLGDMSIDDPGFRVLPRNYCKLFRQSYLSRFPAPVRVLSGNHDCYPNDVWQAIFGTPRQYSVLMGGAMFIMLDTFNGSAHDAGGSPYTPVDADWLAAECEKAGDTPIFLCAHYFDTAAESDAFRALVRGDRRIRGLFQGHTHRAHSLTLDASYGGKPLVDIGGFSYYTQPTGGVWDFNVFHETYAWGYNILTGSGSAFETRHIAPAVRYFGSNRVCDYPGLVSDAVIL